jgi:hypothetical protein
MVRGVNQFEMMYYPATSTPGHGGPAKYMQDPAYPALLSYTRRMSFLLAMGRPAASVALYLPSDSMWLDDKDADTAFVATEQMLAERLIDFDIVGMDALAADLKLVTGNDGNSRNVRGRFDGGFETMSGNRYKTVIIPSASVISQAMLERLQAFAKAGGKVLFLGKTPSLISGKTILDARTATVKDFAWAIVETSAQLPPTPTPPAQAPATPPAAQVVAPAIEKAVMAAVGTPTVTLDTADTTFKVMQRRLKDSDVYLFFNEGAQASNHAVTFRSDGQLVEEWDPVTGKVLSAVSTREMGTMTVKLALKPYETRLLMVR